MNPQQPGSDAPTPPVTPPASPQPNQTQTPPTAPASPESLTPQPVNQAPEPTPQPTFPEPTPTPTSGPFSASATPAPAPNPAPTVSGPVVGGGGMPMPPQAAPSPKNNKRRLLLIAVPLLAILLLAGGVFGLYLPNQPGAVWNTGLNRTGKALDELVISSTEKEQLAAYQASEASGTLSVKSNDLNVDGDITSKYDDKSSDTKLNVNIKTADKADSKLDLQLLTELEDDKRFPNIWFKLNGLDTLGLDSLLGQDTLDQVQGRWLSASADYLEETLGGMVDGSDSAEQGQTPSAADIAEMARAGSKVTREYLLTSDNDKAVLEQKEFVGKETVDGLKTYHYKFAIRAKQATDYCKALVDAELSTKAYKRITGYDDTRIATEKSDAKKACDDDIKDYLKEHPKDQDIWIDAKYKLIHKVRITDDKESKDYTEFGQTYTGGDEIKLFVNFNETSSESKGTFTMTSNTKTNVTKFSMNANGGSSENIYDAKLDVTFKPLKDGVTITKPTDAKPIKELIEQLTGNYSQAEYQSQTTYLES